MMKLLHSNVHKRAPNNSSSVFHLTLSKLSMPAFNSIPIYSRWFSDQSELFIYGTEACLSLMVKNKTMKLPSICKKRKGKGSWKLSLFKNIKAISSITKPKTLKNSNSVLSSEDTARFISALETSWSSHSSVQSRQYCLSVLPTDSGELLEMVNKALRSNRLFFEPGKTNSILEAARFPFEDCVALALETTGDPYMDFRVSMEEIVEACELKDQEHLEELLAWYLKMNKKKNHGFIVGAFIDMFATVTSCSTSCPVSAFSSSSRTAGL